MISNARPLLLFGLVSKNVFGDTPKTDFFIGLLPFFEPFLAARNGQLLSLESFLEYSRNDLKLTISREVGEIFVSRMSQRGWLSREHSSYSDTLWRITYSSNDEIDTRFKTLEADLASFFASVKAFAKTHYPHKEIPSDEELEEDFLLFLLNNFTTQALPEDGTNATRENVESWHYIFARYIQSSAKEGISQIELIERLTGVALIAETLAELRAPSLSLGKSKNGVVAYIDAPLIMARLGLSGKAEASDSEFLMEKLRASNIHVECLRHACDEIRDNLLSLLSNPRHLRTGPTAAALLRGEIQEVFCTAVANDPEHYVREIAGISVRNERLGSIQTDERFFPSSLTDIVAAAMPSSNFIARERDALSIGIVMRRRSGHQSRSLLDAKSVFITSNNTVVSAANNILRARGFLSNDRSVIGPAVTSRTISGLIFANAGTADRKEISHRQLLGACARVAMLRPRIVDQVRDQFSQLTKVEDERMLNALLTQPRAAEVFMDYTVGEAKTISPENYDELISLMKKSLVQNEIAAVTGIIADREKSIFALEAELSTQKAEAETSRIQASERISEEREKASDLKDQISKAAQSIGQNSLLLARIYVYGATAVATIVLVVIFAAGTLYSTSSFGYAMAWLLIIIGVFSFIAWALDIKATWIDAAIKRIASKRLKQSLASHGLARHSDRFDIMLQSGRLELRETRERTA